MSYNGLEDPQSWPFSVRYTASPYRKSKFPVDGGVKASNDSTGSRDNLVPSTSETTSTSGNLILQHSYQHQFQPIQHPSQHWVTSGGNSNGSDHNDGGIMSSSTSYRSVSGGPLQGTASSVINPSGVIKCNGSSSGTTLSSSSSTSHQLGSLLPLHQVVPHHQANQPLFAQALVNYHNTQNSNSNSNFRHHLHNQRQLQFQKGGSAGSGGLVTRGNNLALGESSSSHLHQLHQYQNQERKRMLQQRLLLRNSSHVTPSSGGGGGHFHPFLINGGSGGGSSVHPDHNHYGLPGTSALATTGSLDKIPQPPQLSGILGSSVLPRNDSNSQQIRQRNAVWHLLAEKKDLDQVEGLDEGYIEDLKQPFLFQQHTSLPPTHQQINSIKLGPGGVPLSSSQQTTTTPFPPHFQGSSLSGFQHHHHFLHQQSNNGNGRSAPQNLPMVFSQGAPPYPHNDRGNVNTDSDPYSYVYDSHIQDDLMLAAARNGSSHFGGGSVDLRSLNSLGGLGDSGPGELVGFNGAEFPNKVILAATLSNTSSLQGLPPSLRTGFNGAPTATTNGGSSDEDASENEYEEIQEVARYMNSASLLGHPPPPHNSENSELLISSSNSNNNSKKGGSVNSSSSPDANYEYDSVHPNYDDVGLASSSSTNEPTSSDSMNLLSVASSGIGGEGEINARTSSSNSTNGTIATLSISETNNSSSSSSSARRSPPLGPPRHFKSFSSTDDILAEVVQVQQKHDRVLDQLNLEVENLLIRSTKQEIEQNELNCQRSHNMIMLRNGSSLHSHNHQQGNLSAPDVGKCLYCVNQGSGSCQHSNHNKLNQQEQKQMCSGGASSSSEALMMNMNSGGSGTSCSSSHTKGEGIKEGGGGGENDGMGLMNTNGSCNCCCCCGCCGDNNANGNFSSSVAAPISSSSVGSKESSKGSNSSWRDTLKASLLSGFHNHGQHHHSASASGGGANNSGNNGTFSRKKKLDRNAPGQLSDTNLKHKLNTLSAIQSHNEQFRLLLEKQKQQSGSTSCTSLCVEDNKNGGGLGKNNMNVVHTLNHHHLMHGPASGKGGWKGRYQQRTHSLIPNWKIRDHLMRLPFLRQHRDKLKKGDGVTGSSCSSLHTPSFTTTTGGTIVSSATNTNGSETIPKSISGGVDYTSTASSSLLDGYNKNLQCNSNHHHNHSPLLQYSNGNHPCVSSCIAQKNQQQNSSKNIMSSCGSNNGSTAVNSSSCSSGNTCSQGTGGTMNNPSIKLVRSSSMDELRPTEEHWYSADSDTEPDSLTAILSPPPQSEQCCKSGNSNNNGEGNGGVIGGDLNNGAVTVTDQGQKSSSSGVNINGGQCCGESCVGQHHPSVIKSISGPSGSSSSNVIGNIYTNSPNGVVSAANINTSSSGNCVSAINGCGGGVVGGGGTAASENGTRMDVVPTTIIPDVPKAPKFRRGTQGLKVVDKWRESWSHSKTLSKNNMEEDNRLLRWFSLRKNSATLDSSGGPSNNHRNSTTLPQLTEEDLKRLSFMEDEEGYWPRRTVQPPSLPPPPADLSSDQITRRHIIAAIVHSENSYVAALQRLVNEYKKPLECSHPAMLSHSKISSIFHRVPEILQSHSLFRIALAECVRRWDAEEKIGDVFVASFSKTLVLDVYSEFINNFGNAMETAKLEARRKSAFAEFLKVKQMTAHDRLSLFGLMVKPVQRFPQFILLLQDLLKHTPKDHHDRMSLQLALTQLESLAAMLNERKRESEQYQAFKETIKSIGGGKFVLLRNAMDDPNRILLRQDVVTQLEFDSNGGTVAKSKCRKLLLLNDMLICTTLNNTSSSDHNLLNRKNSTGTVGLGGNTDDNNGNSSVNNNGISSTTSTSSTSIVSGGKLEKSMFKWSFPVREVEVEDISISPTMSRFVQNSTGGNRGTKGNSEDTASLQLLEEMQSLMHDYEVLSRVLTLVQSLKSSYEGLTESTVKELMLEIQNQIQRRDEQISYFDSSCLTLLLGSGNNKEKVIFQMQSPQARNDWVEELRLAQLALDPSNSPAWDIPLESPYPLHKLPLFVRALPVCKSPHLTTVKCGCYFTHTFVSKLGRSNILDCVWLASTDGMSSHITAFRSQQNALKEVSSFDMVEEKVNDLLFVMGHIWMGCESRKMMVYEPSDPDKGSIAQCLLSSSVIKMTLYNNAVYAGLADGNLAVFTELSSPKSKLTPEVVVKLGPDRITSIFGSKDNIYAACGNAVVSIDVRTHTIERNVVLTHHNGSISHMACSGVGLWIATHESGTVCLYHLESLQHLQDVSIAPSVFRTVRDSFRRAKGVHVTCLMAHKGWLWIGTNLGVVLTIPLPRLEGVPIISTGNANVSFHGFVGPVSFLMPLIKPNPMLLPVTQQKHQQNNKQHSHNHHQKEYKENNLNKGNNDENSYTEMSSSMSPPTKNLNVKTSTPVVAPSLAGGELCLSLNSSKNNDNSSERIGGVSFIDNDVSIKENDETDYVNNTSTGNEEEQRHDSLSSQPSVEGSPSVSFNQIGSGPIDNGSTGGSDRSSCNSMERGVTPVSSASSPSASVTNSKTLVVLRKKSSKDNVFLRNCKTLPRGGPIPSRFSIESDVYGLYGNLINVRGLEDEGRFVDPLYDALRRSDPELNVLDAKVSTLDRRLKMRMSRPRSLDLSNWSVDSKISASSDESVGLGSRSSQQTTDSNNTPIGQPTNGMNNNHSPTPPTGEVSDGRGNPSTNGTGTNSATTNNTATASKKTMARQKHKSVKGPQERTIQVVVGGRGYLNMRTQPHPDHFLSSNMESESKSCTHLTLWQMKT